ncbi:hypothetical protein JZ751_016179 [Albula glossodonta]|uniref:Uncharacterized protein n=1 Tax=Albula glossodonta TaxID=121402 RepID=A0A8T2MWS7_9TELE|nr:hypothetical protein JZ751_016179 [Albula glossodonta]
MSALRELHGDPPAEPLLCLHAHTALAHCSLELIFGRRHGLKFDKCRVCCSSVSALWLPLRRWLGSADCPVTEKEDRGRLFAGDGETFRKVFRLTWGSPGAPPH